MSEISAEQVAHLASLARIDLSPEEIESLTNELGQIVEAVAKVHEVAGPDVPATSHPLPLTNVFRPDVVVPVADRRAGAVRRPRPRGRQVQGRPHPGRGVGPT